MTTTGAYTDADAVAAVDLHDTVWARRGWRVVRRGDRNAGHDQGPFLLLEPMDLVDFDASVVAGAGTTRLDIREIATVYEERVVVDEHDRLVDVARDYVTPATRDHDVFVTTNPRVACAWARCSGARTGRWAVRRAAGRLRPPRRTCPGRWCNAERPDEALQFAWRLGEAANFWPRPTAPRLPRGKRLFDIVFATAALAGTAPFLPFIMLAIWIEDGRPLLFAHTRQTRGGRNFVCYKLRTMCREAEQLKPRLVDANVCDGPQFFVRRDPRLLRTGRWLRRLHLDELPQFYNVLRGDMSVVGPRPSPDAENRYCPAWREARLSVRPGITGLWQVRRTRQPQMDFHEWIRYDLEYVRDPSWRKDIRILWDTVRCLLGWRRSRDEMEDAVVLSFPEERPHRRAA